VTDEEWWLGCNDPEQMLDAWLGNKSRRKTRLFACACCRLIWDRLASVWREAVESSERFADGEATKEEVRARFNEAATHAGEGLPFDDALQVACWACNVTYPSQVAGGAAHRIKGMKAGLEARAANLVRDLFRPFRRVSVRKSNWFNSTANDLAQAIYADRAFERMPILADALEDAGCTNADILEHCRHSGEHGRGCWVVDLILGKK
jgi:hypothetical protein